MASPSYLPQQGYLQAAPDGMDISSVMGWPQFLGRHTTVAVIDGDWLPTHEDLVHLTNNGRVDTLGDPAPLALPTDEVSHGTKTMGVLAGESDGKGVTGIVPGARFVFSRPYGSPAVLDTVTLDLTSTALLAAAPYLSPGDVVLVEREASNQPAELEPWVLHIIQTYGLAGVHVVVAAGNQLYGNLDTLSSGFFGDPLNDSGSIMVGAGQAPGGSQPARSYGFKTYGSRIDVQGWGESVVTTDSKDGMGLTTLPTESYTDGFNCTSSASAMVAGVSAIASEVARRLSGAPLPPATLRALLAQTGSPQEDYVDLSHNYAAVDWPIGPLPDLRALIKKIRWTCYGVPYASPATPPPATSRADLFVLQGLANGLDACEIAWLAASRRPPGRRPGWLGLRTCSNFRHPWLTIPPSSVGGLAGRAVSAVERRVRNLITRFGASSLLELVVMADDWGLVT